MVPRTPIVERAYQLATLRAGSSVDDIRRTLRSEGYFLADVQEQIIGAVAADLKRLLRGEPKPTAIKPVRRLIRSRIYR